MNRLFRLPLMAQVIAFAGFALLLTLVGNAVHPSGLTLDRDYFPASGGATSEEGLLPEHPFATIDGAELLDIAEFAVGEEPDVYALDARPRGAYEAGHIPGAFHVDPYQDEPDPDLVAQLKSDAVAVIAVYCRGGDCEDSLNLAHELVYRQGLPIDLVQVYEGGMLDWTARGGLLAGGPEREGPAVEAQSWEDPEAEAEGTPSSSEPLIHALVLALLLALSMRSSWRARMRPVLAGTGAAALALYAAAKLAAPVEFLKAVHGYGVLPTEPPFILNLAGAGVPWMEMAAAFCLITGLLRRGAGLVVSAFLAVFTLAILLRAGDEAGASLLTHAFDCGCGNGVVIVWQKVLSNLALFGVLATMIRRPATP